MGATALGSCCISRDGQCETDAVQRPISSCMPHSAVQASFAKPPPPVRRAPERPIPRRKCYSASCVEEGDISNIRGRLGSLSSVINDIQAEIIKMKLANGELIHKNDDLMGENMRLKRFLAERAASKDLMKSSTLFEMADSDGSPVLPRFLAAAGA